MQLYQNLRKEENLCHKIEVSEMEQLFTNPIEMKKLIGRIVKINTVENLCYTGTLCIMDPIYKTLILQNKEADSNKMETVFILYHSFKSLEILSENIDEAFIKKQGTTRFVNITEKQRIKKWLQQRFIIVEDVEDYLKIDNNLIILPPFTVESCISNNTIILENIRNIISLMPKDFN
ncbi:uncharacterized protein LOC132708174 [Cylas formicarius]|uniref:uncharacterized protein LOC132708174 n=1 Tax=Cylas formicarius TaxID=197179 RepID=UPI002958345D|nr:uncharacterized protein LOC132708174 [Cylas formicarius]